MFNSIPEPLSFLSLSLVLSLYICTYIYNIFYGSFYIYTYKHHLPDGWSGGGIEVLTRDVGHQAPLPRPLPPLTAHLDQVQRGRVQVGGIRLRQAQLQLRTATDLFMQKKRGLGMVNRYRYIETRGARRWRDILWSYLSPSGVLF